MLSLNFTRENGATLSIKTTNRKNSLASVSDGRLKYLRVDHDGFDISLKVCVARWSGVKETNEGERAGLAE